MSHTTTSSSTNNKKPIIYIAIFLLIAIGGLAYVKWVPYYGKGILSFTTHSIGDSILGSPDAPSHFTIGSAWDYALVYFNSVWKAAVFGILLGSLVQVLIPANWLMRVLGKTSFGSTAIAGLSSLPGMMCTCCAAPVAVGLRKKNVSVGASLAFWLGNPTLNPAVLVFMTFVLSWKFAVLRVVFGVVLTFGVSYWANRFMPKANPETAKELMSDAENADESGSFMARWLRSMGTMILYIVPAYILSVLLMGAVRGFLFPHIDFTATSTWLLIILFAIGGMLFVIPTAAEIPIIQTFMAFGLGGGPASALLITLPAISLPSLLLVARSFPRKVLYFVSGSVVGLGILCGVAGMLIM